MVEIGTTLIGALDAPLDQLWVWLAFGETSGTGTLVGGLIVYAAVAAHNLREARKREAIIALSE